MSEEFRAILKERARGPGHLGPLGPELCERAMELILAGEATPAQVGGFLLVGRAVGDTPGELAAYTRPIQALVREVEPPPSPPIVAVTGGFDGKTRTFNVGAAASLVAAAAGGRVLLLGCEETPPKVGRTVFNALRNLGVPSPHPLEEAERRLGEVGFAATTTDYYLRELHNLLQLRREMARRTALNVVEKMVSPGRGSRFAIGITHRPFLLTISRALVALGVEHALIFQAIEGSDEAPLDGNSMLVQVNKGKIEEFRIPPESLGLLRATKADVSWKGEEEEARRLLGALAGDEGPVHDLILYNAALRLWVTDETIPLEAHLEDARAALHSGVALEFIDRLRGRVLVDTLTCG